MNFNRLNYDTCTYKYDLKQSLDVGNYVLDVPQINCNACFPIDPLSGTLGYAPSVVPHEKLVDIDSELIGIRRKSSKCPTNNYIPDLSKTDENRYNLTPIADCRSITHEGTRLSNPPCTLRGQGWNRWEPLIENPQDRAEVPFRFNVNNRILVKDNHRPLIHTPINPAPVLPPNNRSEDVVSYNKSSICNSIPETDIEKVQYWDTCNTLSKII
jgi:hypothetical protein